MPGSGTKGRGTRRQCNRRPKGPSPFVLDNLDEESEEDAITTAADLARSVSLFFKIFTNYFI